MPASPPMRELLPGLWQVADTCNVYIVRDGDRAVAFDFGSGRWLAALSRLGIRRLDHVFLTHHHADQCAGLLTRRKWPFTVHAPVGEGVFLDPETMRTRADASPFGKGCPASYCAPRRGIPGIQYDISGFSTLFWGNRHLRFLLTPGHGPNACSVLLDHEGRQVVFCGDAAHAGGTLWEPYHLEWDHWTGKGALAAWEGIQRLQGIGIDLLCPSHGPVVKTRVRTQLTRLAGRLMRFHRAKGQIASGERDAYVAPDILACGARRYLPHLFQFGANSYLLTSPSGRALVVDPYEPDMPVLESLLRELQVVPTVAAVTHYHFDHCSGIPYLQRKHGVRVWLHPKVAEPLRAVRTMHVPWLPTPEAAIHADQVWPENGRWTWEEYSFRIAHWPGQTWWHCVFMAAVDGQKVLFGGDSFQPPSRWNGTGGFCAYNGSRFREGFTPSARLALAWRPDLIAAGHSTFCRFRASRFRKILNWSRTAERAVRDLCPGRDIRNGYFEGVAAAARGPGRFLWVVN